MIRAAKSLHPDYNYANGVEGEIIVTRLRGQSKWYRIHVLTYYFTRTVVRFDTLRGRLARRAIS